MESNPWEVSDSRDADGTDDIRSRVQRAFGGAYRIERELGGGGSSRVFAAVQTELDRRVVVKLLPPDLAAGLNVERFRHEIRFAARLQHPHIVPLLAAGTADGLPYYTMPFVEGESLRERIARDGALPVNEVVRIARDIADALACAHGHGIVHRDVKPGNVLLSAGHALVTDFGVSKALSDATGTTALTSVGIAIGTPTYMAPEQAAADRDADHHADIYALGVVAYEMLAGSPPFAAATTRRMLAAHATELPESVARRRPDTPPALAALVMRCLEKRPADRPATAAELRDALDSLALPRGRGATGIVGTTRRPALRARPLVAAGVLAAVALAVVALGGQRLYDLYANRAELDPRGVLVAPLANQTGDPRLDPVGTMAADWIARGMSETGLADAVPAAPKRDVRGRSVPGELEPASLARQAQDRGVGRVVAGSIYAMGDSIQLHVRLLDAVEGKVLMSVPPATGARRDPMPAVAAVRLRVLGALAATSPSEAVGIVSVDAPASYAAFREFLRGEEAFSRGEFRAAIEHDRRALAIDSAYLAPLVRMAYAYFNLEQCAQTDSLGRILNAMRERLPAYEGHFLDRVLAWCRGDWMAAYVASKQILATAPHSSYAKYIAARAGFFVNRPREVVAALERLDPTRSHISGYYTDYDATLHQLGRHERELEMTELFRERHGNSLLPLLDRVRALCALGRIEDVRRAVAESRTLPSNEATVGPFDVAWRAWEELAAHGHPAESRRIAAEFVEWLRERPRTERGDAQLARALLAAGRPAEAREIARRLVAAHAHNVDYAIQLGEAAAAMGDRAEAMRVSRMLGVLDQPYLNGENILGQAVIAARLGERARAVVLLREAIRRGQAQVWILHIPPLRGYPPYEELMKPDG